MLKLTKLGAYTNSLTFLSKNPYNSWICYTLIIDLQIYSKKRNKSEISEFCEKKEPKEQRQCLL